MKNLYIYYYPDADISYLYLLYFYNIAEYNSLTNRYDTIHYSSLRQLTERLNSSFDSQRISLSTVKRILSNDLYIYYIKNNKESKIITINNDVYSMQKKSFVKLTQIEASFLMQQKDDFLCKYFLYQKYYCGYSKSKCHNSTIKQMLAAMGYSANNKDYISRISSYNTLLSSFGLLNIQQYKEDGKLRNIYSFG